MNCNEIIRGAPCKCKSQMKFDDISDTKSSDPDITPLATPAKPPPAQGKQLDGSSQGQCQPPLDTPDDDLEFFAIYYDMESAD